MKDYFDRKESNASILAGIEERVWRCSEEKFVDYANGKLKLMNIIDPTDLDQIDLSAARVKDPTFRPMALTSRMATIGDFLHYMRRMTEDEIISRSTPWIPRKSNHRNATAKSAPVEASDIACYKCCKRGQRAQQCPKVECFKCQQTGQISPNYPQKDSAFKELVTLIVPHQKRYRISRQPKRDIKKCVQKSKLKVMISFKLWLTRVAP